MNPKITWAGLGIVAVVALGYLASRVGNIGARGVRDGESVELTVPDQLVAGERAMAHWTTPLNHPAGPVVLKARTSRQEVAVGQGEFGAGQTPILVLCELGGSEISVVLDKVNENGTPERLAQAPARVLPQGPDCL